MRMLERGKEGKVLEKRMRRRREKRREEVQEV